MDGNKDEALKCIKIAQNALNTGNKEKAVKFLRKSINLFPTKEAQDLFKKIRESAKSHQKAHSQSNGATHGYGTFSQSQNNTGTSTPTQNKPIEKDYTPEQHEAIKRIKKSKDYYEILGIEKDASSSELKKAYRKLALQLHPDKNKAPGATEAFKAVGKAFSILSDDEKRRQYDLYGPEEEQRTTRRRHRHANMYDDNDFDPDEIFKMFFGGGYPTGNVRVFRRGNTFYSYRNGRGHAGHEQEERGQENSMATFIQFMPVIILLALSLFSNLLIQESPYSLYYKSDYQYQRTTKKLSVNYFVKKSFDTEYTGTALRRMESTIEDDYIEYLRSSCYSERIQKENLRRKGIYFSNKDYLKKAENFPTPHCEKLEKLFR